jgi:hypothetical protein
MKSIDTARRAVVALASVAATAACTLALGGCGSATPTKSVVPAGAANSTSTDPKALVLADANRLIASFARIPGAVRLSQAPSVLEDTAAHTTSRGSGQGVVVEGWYSVPQPYQDTMTRAQAVLASQDGGIGPNGKGSDQGIRFLDLSWPHLYADARGERDLDVTAFGLTAQTSALHIEVTDYYRPAKTAAEKFPDSGALDVSFGSVSGDTKPDESFDVTGAATIKQISALLDALPTVPLYGPAACPAMTVPAKPSPRHEIGLTFRPAPGGTQTVRAELYQPLGKGLDTPICGLGLVSVTVGGTAQPALDPAGTSIYAEVAKLLGLPSES